jgi:hypothetical protein
MFYKTSKGNLAISKSALFTSTKLIAKYIYSYLKNIFKII